MPGPVPAKRPRKKPACFWDEVVPPSGPEPVGLAPAAPRAWLPVAPTPGECPVLQLLAPQPPPQPLTTLPPSVQPIDLHAPALQSPAPQHLTTQPTAQQPPAPQPGPVNQVVIAGNGVGVVGQSNILAVPQAGATAIMAPNPAAPTVGGGPTATGNNLGHQGWGFQSKGTHWGQYQEAPSDLRSHRFGSSPSIKGWYR